MRWEFETAEFFLRGISDLALYNFDSTRSADPVTAAVRVLCFPVVRGEPGIEECLTEVVSGVGLDRVTLEFDCGHAERCHPYAQIRLTTSALFDSRLLIVTR